MALHWKRQEADDTPHEQLRMRTTLMTNSGKFTLPGRIPLEQAAGAIGLHVNADKMEYIRFYQSGDISSLNGGSLKLADKLNYQGRERVVHRKWHQYVTSKDMDSYWLAIGHTEVRPIR